MTCKVSHVFSLLLSALRNMAIKLKSSGVVVDLNADTRWVSVCAGLAGILASEGTAVPQEASYLIMMDLMCGFARTVRRCIPNEESSVRYFLHSGKGDVGT